jgi:Flp pilus assembly protein TadD
MAPEQARGERLDARADVFALGGMLAHVLVGRPPFRGADVQTTLSQAAAGETTEVMGALAGCPADAELVALARHCLAPYRDDRPADGTAVAGLVAAYRAGVEEQLRAAERDRTAAEVQAAEQRKRRKVQVALAAAVGLLAVGTAAAAWWHDRQETTRDRLEREAAATELRQQAFRDKVEQDTAAADFRLQVEDDKRRQAEHERKARAADAVANLLARTRDALRSGDADRAAPFIEQAGRRAKDEGLADHAARLAAYQADLTVLRALDSADGFRWSPVGGKLPDRDAVVGRFAAAFAGYGIVPGTTPPAEAAERINASTGRDALLAGLDAWLARARRPELRDLLAAVDPDRFRNEVRSTVTTGDAAAFAALAGRPEWEGQPAGLVRAFGRMPEIPAGAQRALLGRAAADRPSDFGLVMDLAECYSTGREADGADAARWYQAAAALRPGSVAARYNLGIILDQRGDHAGAVACFREVIRFDPTEAKAHTNLGAALKGLGDAAGAEKEFREAIRLDPKNGSAHSQLGVVLIRRGDVDGAVDAFRAATRADPAYKKAYVNLGLVLRQRGDLTGAVAAYREAIRIDPTFMEAHFSLGNALAQGGDLDGAAACFREAARLDPGFAPARASLARALAELAARRPVAPAPREVRR